MRALGSVIIAPPRPAPEALSEGRRTDAYALYMAERALIVWRSEGVRVEVAAPGGLLVDMSRGVGAAAIEQSDGLVLLLPRRLLTGLDPGAPVRVISPSAVLGMLRLMGEMSLSTLANLGEAQSRILGQAIAEILAIALTVDAGGGRVAPLRAASLRERVVSHIDAHLADDLGVEQLCEALSCSRSALYRAVHAEGGVSALIVRRRLEAVHRILRDHADQRSIAAIARDNGFADASRFSRIFKRYHGVTAASLRRERRSGSAGGPDGRR